MIVYDVEYTSYSWVYEILFMGLFIAAVVAVSLILYDCYRELASQRKQKEQRHPESNNPKSSRQPIARLDPYRFSYVLARL
jgi:hypothetical protein